MSEVVTSGLLLAQSAWGAAFAGLVAWRLGRLMRVEDQGRRREQLDRLLRTRGVPVDLARSAEELLSVCTADPRALLGDEAIFRESATRWIEALLRGSVDPRAALDDIERLRRRLGFGFFRAPSDLPADRLLLTFDGHAEVLEARVVATDGAVLDVVAEVPRELEVRALRDVSALFAVGDEIATCECRIAEVRELAGGALWWRLEMPCSGVDQARREQHRVPLRLAGRVVLARDERSRVESAEPLGDEPITAAFLLDMSLGGVRLRVAADVLPGDRVWLSVGRCDRSADELEMAGRVIWTLREDGFATATAGVAFDAFDAATRARVARFLARRSVSAESHGEEDRSC